MVIISISGTPGTGKTSVAEILAKKLKANLINIKEMMRKNEIRYSYDRKRKTSVIDERELQKAVSRKLQDGYNIIDSHLSHLLKANRVFILRTNPIVLRRRLKKRGWAESKIKENVEAEILDEITIESLQKRASETSPSRARREHNKENLCDIHEIDTSLKGAKRTAEIIYSIIKKKTKGQKAGKIDWTKKYGKILMKMANN